MANGATTNSAPRLREIAEALGVDMATFEARARTTRERVSAARSGVISGRSIDERIQQLFATIGHDVTLIADLEVLLSLPEESRRKLVAIAEDILGEE